MILSQNDAYAFRRILCNMEIPAELELSPMVKLLIDALDPLNNKDSWEKLNKVIKENKSISQQMVSLTPSNLPHSNQDDGEYINSYIELVTSKSDVPPPDTTRTNGSTSLIQRLYEANKEGGAAAAQALYSRQKARSTNMLSGAMGGNQVEYMDEDRIVQAKEITAVVGQPGCGKSFWALMKTAEIADHSRVMYVMGEGMNPERIVAMIKGRNLQGLPYSQKYYDNDFDGRFAVFQRPIDFTTDTGVEDFLIDIDIFGFTPELLVVDTFASCTSGMDENSSKELQPVLDRIRTMIMEPLGCAVLLIHHTTKDGKTFRGSSALRANVANMYYLSKKEDILTLRADKRRDGEMMDDIQYRLVPFETRRHFKTGEQLSSVAAVPVDKLPEDYESRISKAKPIASTTKKSSAQQKVKQPRFTANQRKIMEMLLNAENGITLPTLQDITGISKTTLWRNVQKLEKRGFLCTGQKGEPVRITADGKEFLNGKEKK